MQITTIGLDIAKNVFQVHGIDAAEVVVKKQQATQQIDGVFQESAAVLDRHGPAAKTAALKGRIPDCTRTFR